ncbi:MAG: hypothetical protein ACI38A_00310 [Candidatus Ornithomonoglobus sp.]
MLNIDFAAAFAAFYTDPVEVLKITETGAYTKTRTKTSLGYILADLQPYSGDLAEKDYGLKKDCQLRLFCAPGADVSKMLTEGNYVRVIDSITLNDALLLKTKLPIGHTRPDGGLYRIEYAPKWGAGGEAILKEAEGFD